jgi:general secretion pathway protein H
LRGDRRRFSAGFTLLELVVALAILGLVLAITLPLLGRRNADAAVAGAAIEIRAALRTARDAAIVDSRPVIFRGDKGGYWIDRRRYLLGGISGSASGIRIAVLGGQRISFFPSGGSSGGHILVRGASLSREIAVDPLTGRAALLR